MDWMYHYLCVLVTPLASVCGCLFHIVLQTICWIPHYFFLLYIFWYTCSLSMYIFHSCLKYSSHWHSCTLIQFIIQMILQSSFSFQLFPKIRLKNKTIGNRIFVIYVLSFYILSIEQFFQFLLLTWNIYGKINQHFSLMGKIKCFFYMRLHLFCIEINKVYKYEKTLLAVYLTYSDSLQFIYWNNTSKHCMEKTHRNVLLYIVSSHSEINSH